MTTERANTKPPRPCGVAIAASSALAARAAPVGNPLFVRSYFMACSALKMIRPAPSCGNGKAPLGTWRFRLFAILGVIRGVASKPPAHTSVAAPDPRRRLAVVPLIPNQRYYGESPARVRGGPQDGLVQGWRNRGPEARLFKGAKLSSAG